MRQISSNEIVSIIDGIIRHKQVSTLIHEKRIIAEYVKIVVT